MHIVDVKSQLAGLKTYTGKKLVDKEKGILDDTGNYHPGEGILEVDHPEWTITS